MLGRTYPFDTVRLCGRVLRLIFCLPKLVKFVGNLLTWNKLTAVNKVIKKEKYCESNQIYSNIVIKYMKNIELSMA